MAEGCIYIYTGDGRGKSPAAIGRAVQAAVEGKRVVIIQFLKGKGLGDSDFLRRMEPEIKLFRFEKSDGNFVELPEEKKQEEIQNIRNGIGFAKKVLTTGECDLLILDEVLGLVEKDIITEDDLKALLECRGDTDVILTGITLNDEICVLTDENPVVLAKGVDESGRCKIYLSKRREKQRMLEYRRRSIKYGSRKLSVRTQHWIFQNPVFLSEYCKFLAAVCTGRRIPGSVDFENKKYRGKTAPSQHIFSSQLLSGGLFLSAIL